MKNWMKSILMAFLLVATISVTALAAGSGSGRLTAKENDVAVSLNIPEGKTMTSLRVKLKVTPERGSMKEPVFQFENAIKSAIKDAAVSREANGGYLVDLILSGKKDQVIVDSKGNVNLGTLSVYPDSEEYQIKVDFAGIKAEGEQPDVSYVEADGTSEISVLLSGAESVVLKKINTEPPTEEPTEKPTETPTETPDPNPPEQTPAAPRTPELKAEMKTGSKVVVFTWNKIDEADGYELYEYNSSTKAFALIQDLTYIMRSVLTR